MAYHCKRALGCFALAFALTTLGCGGEASEGTAAAQVTHAAETRGEDATAAVACGQKGQPDCPLQGWMKANLQSQMRAKDFARLQTALEALAGADSPPYTGWNDLAAQGAAAAAGQDLSGLPSACKGCHDQHRAAFRRDMRAAASVVPQ